MMIVLLFFCLWCALGFASMPWVEYDLANHRLCNQEVEDNRRQQQQQEQTTTNQQLILGSRHDMIQEVMN